MTALQRVATDRHTLGTNSPARLAPIVAAFDRIPSLGVHEPRIGTRKNGHKERAQASGSLSPSPARCFEGVTSDPVFEAGGKLHRSSRVEVSRHLPPTSVGWIPTALTV